MNAENGYPLQEALDNGGSAGISTLNSQYLNNAGQGSVLSLTPDASQSSLTPDPSPTGEGSENQGGGTNTGGENTGGDNGGGDNGGGSAGFETGN